MDLNKLRAQHEKRFEIEHFKKAVRDNIQLHSDFRQDQLYETGQQFRLITSTVSKVF